MLTTSMLKKEFFYQCGKELKKLRLKNHLTLSELSHHTKINQARIDLAERGKSRQIWLICKILTYYNKHFEIKFKA